MTITALTSAFTLRALPAGSSLYNGDELWLARVRNAASTGANFVLGYGAANNVNPTAGTFDITIEGVKISPATASAPIVSDPAPIDVFIGVPDDNNYQLRDIANRQDGGFMAIVNRGPGMASTGFAVRAVSPTGVASTTFEMAPQGNNSFFGMGITQLKNGNYLVNYFDIGFSEGPSSSIEMGQLLNASGAPVGAAFQISASSTDLALLGNVIDLGNGSVDVYRHAVFDGADFLYSQLRGRMLDANGQVTGADFLIGEMTYQYNEPTASIVSLATGGFAAFWRESTANAPTDPPPSGFVQSWLVKGAFFDASGNRIGAVSTLASGSLAYNAGLYTGAGLGNVTATDLANGGAALVVQTINADNSISQTVHKFSYDGTLLGSEALTLAPFVELSLAQDGSIFDAFVTQVGSSVTIKGQYLDFDVGRTVNGTAFADRLFGDHEVDDSINGGSGTDLLIGLSGNDSLNGGADIDTAVYSVSRTSATITRNLDGSVTINAGAEGIDQLTNMEWAEFTGGEKVWIGAQHADSNNDNRSDILWQNANGTPAIWQMDGNTLVGSAALVNPGTAWKLIGSGDFNGDRKADLLWQNNVTGEVAEWQLNGTTIASGIFLPNPGPTWHAIATGEFNGDGFADIALQSDDGSVAVWNLNAAGGFVSSAVLANPGAPWHLRATGDFNADGRTELLFQHDDGSVATWDVNGTTLVGGNLLPNPTPAWHIKGTGDFNRDGKADIVWQHDNGDVAVWSMQDAANLITGPTTGIVASPGAVWSLGGVGDYDGNGVSDILLQNSSDFSVAIWSMNGTNLTPTGAVLTPNPGAGWHQVA